VTKYKIYPTEYEARTIRALYEDSIITKMLKPKVLKVLLKIGNKIERQADWNTW